MLRTARLLPLQGFRHWASPPAVSPQRRQSATGPPDSYPDRTYTGKQRRARPTINRLHDQPPVSGRTAEEIKQRLAQFLRDDLKLELSQEKTLITHARTGAAAFLGYEITVQHSNRKVTRGRRAVNGVVRLRVPTRVIKAKCALYRQRGKPATRTSLVNRGEFDIVATYGAEYRGLVQFYLLAGDVHRLNRLHGVMRTSLLKTLACKYDSTGQKMAAKYRAKIETPHGLRTCLQVIVDRNGRKPLIARFGGIPLKRQQRRSSPTAFRNGSPTPTRSCRCGCFRAGARSARQRRMW